MKGINLTESAVSFDIASHTYELNGKKLSGVTPIVNWVFDKTYDGIPEDVLKRAAEHGKSVHLDCQMSDAGFEVSSREAKAYQQLKSRNHLTTLANEWLVDDGKDIASSIDVIFTDFSIADIKTTSSIHHDNVSLQLSIYAMLLERMNDGIEVPDIYVIWLPREKYGTPCMIRLERISAEICDKIIAMYLAGDDNTEARALLNLKESMPMPTPFQTMPTEIEEAESQLIWLEQAAKDIKEKKERLHEGLLKLMEKNGIKKYESDNLILTYVEAGTRTSLDSTKIKREHPDIYAECCKTSETKSSLRLKIK